ncbi:MAG: PilZ domain-containing protein [Nitrospirae bacterium]|nr:PilZ domain-containing protein [Nitrospirota bacterium]
MQRRVFERIPVELTVRFYCYDNDYSGTVTNISENGMYICTNNMCFPFSPEFKIVIPLKAEMLNIPVKVRRITKTSDRYDGIGVEIMNPPRNYLDFVGEIRAKL